MIASEKAKDLINTFIIVQGIEGTIRVNERLAKYCAISHCNYMIIEYEEQLLHRGLINKYASDNMIHYWKEVKKEIDKL